MAKIFNHQVIYNGTLYPANTPIPIENTKNEEPNTKEDKQSKKGGAKNENDKGTGGKS